MEVVFPTAKPQTLVSFMDPGGICASFFKEKLKYNYFPMVTQTVKTLPAMQETQVQAPGQEDPLEEEMATRSSVLAERIPWTEEPGGATVHGVMRLTLS